jgi:hypothetical protein
MGTIGMSDERKLSEEAQAEIRAAVAIVASDKNWKMTRAMHDKMFPPTPETDPPKDGDPTAPPKKEGDDSPPAKKAGLWWGDRLDTE